ncbi:MAG: M48 family metalloprotease [Acidobacteriia bacterium]|nr:M48 family metalloprotease [Terriglobia bacterium]
MRKANRLRPYLVLFLTAWFCLSTASSEARTKVKPGFNFFSAQQDIEMGREAAQEAEKQLNLLNDPSAVNYVNQLGKKLAAKSMNPNYPWTFKVVNDSAINAFALPGGFIYVNRGALEAADNEAQISGVIAHEIGHVVARHGTNQMSKALLPQLGLAALGGLTAGKGGWTATLAQLGIPLGLNMYFLKNSRAAEAQADLLGTQEMTDAGYDPSQLAHFFEKLEQGGSGGKVSGAASWFSDHPSPENRVASIDKEISTLSVAKNPVVDTPDFDHLRSHLKSLPPAPKPKPAPAAGSKDTPADTASGGASPAVAVPSGKYASYSPQENLYVVEYPADWEVMSADGSGATFVPKGGIQQINQQNDIVYGIQVSFSQGEVVAGQKDPLGGMTSQLIASILQGNSYLQENRAAQQKINVGGRQVLLSRLEGKSPLRNEIEVVWVATQLYGEGQLFTVLCIAPQIRFKDFEPAFKHTIESVRFRN